MPIPFGVGDSVIHMEIEPTLSENPLDPSKLPPFGNSRDSLSSILCENSSNNSVATLASTSESATNDFDESIDDFFGKFDLKIKQAKSTAEKLQETRYQIIWLDFHVDQSIYF